MSKLEYWIEKLKEKVDPDWNGYNGDSLYWAVEEEEIDSSLTLEEVASYGGEDCGVEYWKVFKVTDTNTQETVFIRFNGYYSSWGDTDWDTPQLVEPREVTVIKYFAVGE